MLRHLLVVFAVAGCNHSALQSQSSDSAFADDLASLGSAEDMQIADMSAHVKDLSLAAVDLSVGRGVADIAGLDVRFVFVSSQTYTGDMGGLLGADAKCQQLADAAVLGGTYKAWLSDHSDTPLTRFTRSTVPYVLVNGFVVANGFNDLISGSLRHAINLTELGTTPPITTGCSNSGQHRVWSDTRNNGTLFNGGETCGEWNDATVPMSAWGDATSQGNWSYACNGGNSPTVGCGSQNAIYCFQQ